MLSTIFYRISWKLSYLIDYKSLTSTGKTSEMLRCRAFIHNVPLFDEFLDGPTDGGVRDTSTKRKPETRSAKNAPEVLTGTTKNVSIVVGAIGYISSPAWQTRPTM